MSNTWFKRVEKRKVTFRVGENETKIDFVLIKRAPMVYAKCGGNPWGVPARIVVSRYNKKIRNVVRKTCTERRKISLLKEVNIRKLFEENVIELFDVGAPNL